ncbi:MAG: hypothetical protein U5J97_05645 [Trueperaceae bacterium]|nr:hypothetical protein [Trueperaceae bacterium]
MHSPPDVTFVERDGPGAETALARLQARLEREGTASRLLRSHDQADLRLLVVDGPAQLTDDDIENARVWRFVDAGPADPAARTPTAGGGTAP